MGTEYELRLSCWNVEADTRARLVPGSPVKVWSRGGLLDISLFAPGTISGEGLIARVPKTQVLSFGNNYQSATATVESVDGTTVVLLIEYEEDDTLPF